MIAALYVIKDGPYYGIEGVDPWTEDRDARLYDGPWAVVAHPPCQRWGRYWSGGPHPRQPRRKLGDDDGCFAAALLAVRRYGGVLEHPEASHAWRAHGLMTPPKDGGWVSAGLWDHGWTCCVEQGHYGHPTRKATWLYVCHVSELPSLKWGKSSARGRLDAGYPSTEERRNKRGRIDLWDMVPKSARAKTPVEFRDILIEIARSVNQEGLWT